jgi:outer membrane protein W
MIMNKYLLSLVLLLLPVTSFAVDLYHYNPVEGCSLRKAVGTTWQVTPASEVGQDSFTIQLSKANAAYSNFKYQGSWYAAKTECFKLSEGAVSAADESITSTGGGFKMQKGKLFVEPKLSLYMMNGANTGGGTANGVTVEKYSAGIGIAAKFGYYLTDHSDLFLELNKFGGSQRQTSGGVTTENADSIFSVNVGYQYFFSKMGAFLPYGGIALGYNKLSQTITGGFENSGSGIGFVLEGGAAYELSSKFALVGALNYTIMSFSELTPTGSTIPIINTLGYSHIGINIGGRYNF